ncbi:MAG TPA: Asp-tRNA(Asn)/Glu-tRNA(Gln) amidotransferase subunit GatC [Candidatus Dormibacteraeota bacterium]|nr:Asp-tRNA(Asn)/Glu-tRNA(Gln) amidotransferase subunit GatC [Candidatus Dormibacteraeota bacterium]
MTKLTTDDIFKLAKLSNILVTELEAKELVGEIEVVLNYVGQLQKLDLANTEPTYQVTGLSNVMRPDEEVDYKISTEDLLKNVPETENNYIKVRRVL